MKVKVGRSLWVECDAYTTSKPSDGFKIAHGCWNQGDTVVTLFGGVVCQFKKCIVLTLRDRRVLVLNDQYPRYSDILALARTTFSSLQGMADEDIVILGGGPDCHWLGYIEIQEKAWECIWSQLASVVVTFKQERAQLERKKHERDQHEKDQTEK